MIGRLAGTLIARGGDHVLLDVQGVGYIVHVSDRTLQMLPSIGAPLALYTDLLVREDLLQLFGFTSQVEKDWHKLLMSVQGIGAKASMAILGTLGPDAVGRAIALGDWAAIKAAPGVGPKIAQRVVNELQAKAPEILGRHDPEVIEIAPPAGEPAPVAKAAPARAPSPAPDGAAQADAMSALANLGYAPAEAARAVAEAREETPEADTSALIRAALKRLAPA